MSEAAFSAEDRFRKLACADFELSAEVCCDFELGDKDAEEGLYVHDVLIRILKTERVLSDFVVQSYVLKSVKLTSLFNLTSTFISFAVGYVYAFNNLISFRQEAHFTSRQGTGYTFDFKSQKANECVLRRSKQVKMPMLVEKAKFFRTFYSLRFGVISRF